MTGAGKFGIIVLAAGSSSRLGAPKQLLSYNDKNLLDHVIEEAKKTADGIVVVILGGNRLQIEENTKTSGITIIYNPDWEEGISSSIRTGLAVLTKENKDLDGVILTVCDQPFITEGLFKTLITNARSTGKSIVASAYSGTLGTPVLFTPVHFSDLENLKGKEGAKILLEKFRENVASVPFENGEIDIDTPEDYKKLIDSNIT